MIRKTIFWTHLICGVCTGLVILMMSVTGVILTYERQMLAWADRDLHAGDTESAQRQSLDDLLAKVSLDEPDFKPTAVTVSSDPRAPVTFSAGRSGTRLVNPFTAEVHTSNAHALESFFGAVEGWHRWFNSTAHRGIARAVTGASNLAFLFLILSGMYLWLPRVFKWAMFRTRLLFNANARSGKARDFNWHHVFGIWSAVPLAVIIASSVVFSYSWANTLLYRSFGESPPQRGGPPPGMPRAQASEQAPAEAALSLDALFDVAARRLDRWETISFQLPQPGASNIRFTLDQGSGGQPQRRHTLVVDARNGDVTAWQPFDSQSPAQRARSWVRFLHTGEALGILGQTIAGIVSLTSIVMVWTGLALAYRRLIVPLLTRRGRSRSATV